MTILISCSSVHGHEVLLLLVQRTIQKFNSGIYSKFVRRFAGPFCTRPFLSVHMLLYKVTSFNILCLRRVCSLKVWCVTRVFLSAAWNTSHKTEGWQWKVAWEEYGSDRGLFSYNPYHGSRPLSGEPNPEHSVNAGMLNIPNNCYESGCFVTGTLCWTFPLS
jgi:hypothetical protein